MAPTMRATVRPTGDRGPIVLPGRRRYERSRLLVAGPVRQLGPASVARWVPWSAAPSVLPSGLVLEKELLISQTREFISYFIETCCHKFKVFQ